MSIVYGLVFLFRRFLASGASGGVAAVGAVPDLLYKLLRNSSRLGSLLETLWMLLITNIIKAFISNNTEQHKKTTHQLT